MTKESKLPGGCSMSPFLASVVTGVCILLAAWVKPELVIWRTSQPCGVVQRWDLKECPLDGDWKGLSKGPGSNYNWLGPEDSLALIEGDKALKQGEYRVSVDLAPYSKGCGIFLIYGYDDSSETFQVAGVGAGSLYSMRAVERANPRRYTVIKERGAEEVLAKQSAYSLSVVLDGKEAVLRVNDKTELRASYSIEREAAVGLLVVDCPHVTAGCATVCED